MPDVLILDRDLPFARSLASRLDAWGYGAQISDGEDGAVQKLFTDLCKVVILGVYRDDPAGLKVISEIYRVDPKVRIVTVGDQSSLEMERQVRLAKVFYYLIRPVDFEELRAVIQRAVGDRCQKA